MNEQKRKPEPTLSEVYKLAKENNHMLHAMRRSAFVGGIVKFVFWIAVFFVIPYILYALYLQPYLSSLQGAYADLNAKVDSVNSAANDLQELKNSFPDIGGILNQFGGN